MIINFNEVPEQALTNFKGGEKIFNAQISGDSLNKILHGRLKKGASIGMHTHETNSEIIFILQGRGTVKYDDTTEIVTAGMCHYCPKGHAHSLMNLDNEELVFFAVIPEH